MVEVDGKRTYSAKLDAPGDGRWIAYFIDFKFHNKHAFPLDIMAMYKDMIPNKQKEGVRFTDKYGFDDFGGFPHDFGRFFEFTTEVSVWPQTFPYEGCTNEECPNRLV